MLKGKIRSSMVAKLNSLTDLELAKKSLSIAKRVRRYLDNQKFKCLGGFYPIKKEPIWHTKVSTKIAYPALRKNNLSFHIAKLKKSSKFNLMVPILKNEVNPDLLVIPGIAFSKNGDRLGRGGGFYDRYLSTFNGIRIGVCFDEQILKKVPLTKTDQPVDVVITDSCIYKRR